MLYLTDDEMVEFWCPLCMGRNLHNKKVTVFTHEEKRETGKILEGIFWCENCEVESILIMGEDHGSSILYWHENTDDLYAP